MLSPRAKVAFWLVIGAILLSGADRIFADPTQAIRRGSLPAGASPVIITEFMASNASGLTDEDDDRPDWIELYNRSVSTVNLEGWTLTDNPAQPDKWTFRPLTLESGARTIVFASGKNRRTIEPEEGRRYPHTNFKLAASGGFLGLYSPTSLRYLTASEFTYPVQYPDISYGIVADEAGAAHEVYFEQPTPAAENDGVETWVGLLEPVEMSAPHGLYATPFTLTLTHPAPLPPSATPRTAARANAGERRSICRAADHRHDDAVTRRRVQAGLSPLAGRHADLCLSRRRGGPAG